MNINSRSSLGLVLGALCFGTLRVLNAGQDCDNKQHAGDCNHSKASNPGMCWSGQGGTGVVVCVSQDSQEECEAAQAYEVKDDFPQNLEPDPTYDVTKGGQVLHCWAEHHNTTSPGQPCYRRVTCTWDDNVLPGYPRCTIVPGSGQTVVDLPKKTTTGCRWKPECGVIGFGNGMHGADLRGS